MTLLFGLLLAILSIFTIARADTKPAACLQLHSFNGENPCRGLMMSWSYNADEDKCVEFIYGGCGGNDNLFGTMKECEDLCKK